MPDFFVDADGGQFAFLKEADSPDWGASIYRSTGSVDSLPADETHSDVLDTTDIRRLVLCLKPGGGVSYKFELHGWEGAGTIPDFYLMDGGVFDAGYTQNKIIRIKAQGIDAFYPKITSVSGGSVELEYAPLPYEE